MSHTQYTNEEIARLGEELYRRDIRDAVLPHHKGEILVLDILSGDYELDSDDCMAEKALRARRPDGVFYGLRVGYTSAFTLSGRMIEDVS